MRRSEPEGSTTRFVVISSDAGEAVTDRADRLGVGVGLAQQVGRVQRGREQRPSSRNSDTELSSPSEIRRNKLEK